MDELCFCLQNPLVETLVLDGLRRHVFTEQQLNFISDLIVDAKNITRLVLRNPEALGFDEYDQARVHWSRAVQKILERGSLIAFELYTSVSVDVGEFGFRTWEMLALAIEHNPRLEKLVFSIRSGGMGAFGCLALTRIVSNNTHIKSLTLDGCQWKPEAHRIPFMQAIGDSKTLKRLSMRDSTFGTGLSSDKQFADGFFADLSRLVFENVSLSSASVRPALSHNKRTKETDADLDFYVKENDRACVTRGCLLMFCLCEAPDESPLTLLRGFPFASKEFPLVSYFKEARGWVPRKAHRWAPLPLSDGKRKDAPGNAEGQSAAKRPK